MRVIKFLLSHSKQHQLYLWGSLVFICLISIDNSFKPFLIKKLIDSIASNTNPWFICSIYILLQFVMMLSWLGIDYCFIKYVCHFKLDINDYFMRKFYSYSYYFFHTKSLGALISKFDEVFKYTAELMRSIITRFLRFILLIIISMILLSKVATIYVFTLIIWIIIFFTVTILSIKKGIIHTNDNISEKTKLIGYIFDYISNILNVKSFVTENYELSQMAKIKQSFLSSYLKEGYFFIKFYAFQGILTSIYMLGFLVALVYGYQEGNVSAGSFALVIMLNLNIINMVYETAYILREFVIQWKTVDQALEILESVPEIQDKPNAFELRMSEGEIVFDSVKFNYKDSSTLFENKSVIIPAKQKIGLVGYSGSGKTTFINLILRLYEISEGKIIIDQQDINEVTQDSLRKNIAIIPQEPTLFYRSILENIRYGKIDATDEQVIEAAKKAHADDFINNLPHSYRSLIGERGVKLSGGQKQRIAIARAILKDAPILILDEATSQLDSITESYIQSSLLELMQNKTTIVIAHRLSTLLHMDRVLVFDSGKIVQDGSHSELLNQEGLYRNMWNAQSDGFLPDKKNEDQKQKE